MSTPFYAGPEPEAERAAQEAAGIPWADGPDRTYEQMELDDAAFAARQGRTAGTARLAVPEGPARDLYVGMTRAGEEPEAEAQI